MLQYYQLLGVPTSATTTQIRQAYLNKIKHLHPDAIGSNECLAQTIQLNHAYQQLFACAQSRQSALRPSRQPEPSTPRRQLMALWLTTLTILAILSQWSITLPT